MRGGLADPGPGDGERRLEGAGGEVGELGRGVVDADVVGQVAGGEPQQDPAVLHAQRVDRLGVGQRRPPASRRRVGADRRRAARRGRRTPRGGCEPSVGSVSSRQCSGWRTRWSPSAVLAPSTAQQPHRGALVVGDLARASRRPRRRLLVEPLGQPQQARRGRGRGRRSRPSGRSSGCAGVAEPLDASRGRAAPSTKPSPDAGSTRPRVGSSASSPRELGEARAPAAASAPSQLGARPPSIVREHGVLRRGRARRASSRSSSAQRREDVGRPPRGGTARPRRARANRADLELAVGRAREHDGARRAGRSTTSSFHWMPRLGARCAARRSGSSAASSVQPDRHAAPTVLAARVARRPRRRAPPRPAGGRGRCPSVGMPRGDRRRGRAP